MLVRYVATHRRLLVVNAEMLGKMDDEKCRQHFEISEGKFERKFA